MPYLAIIFAAVLATGCATSKLEQRLGELETEFRDLRRSHALASQRLREIDRLNQTTFLIQDGIEQLGLEVEELQQTIVDIKGQFKIIDAALFDVNPPKAENNVVSRGAPAAVPRATRTKVESSAVTEEAPVPEPADDRSMYRKAYEAMEQKQTETAVSAFQRLLERHRESDLADNAHYWLGEIFLSLGDADRARTHFKNILDQYPAGNKVPDALYKLGIIAQEHGDCEQALTWYRKVREQYPWSPVTEKIDARTQACGVSN